MLLCTSDIIFPFRVGARFCGCNCVLLLSAFQFLNFQLHPPFVARFGHLPINKADLSKSKLPKLRPRRYYLETKKK